MGGVAPGSPVSAGNTNPAFIDANGDDTGIGKYTLANTDPISGAQVDNIQREHNANSSYTGMPLNSVKTVVPAWTNNDVGTSSDTLKTRSDLLTQKFNNTAGHKHTGAAGDAPPVDAVDLANVILKGYYIQGVDQASITGTSMDVSTPLTGQTPSSSTTVKGVVVNAPYNLVFIRQGSGADINDVYKDGSGNIVYGRLTESAGTWTVSFYVDIAGVETAYNFTSSSDIRWYYQKLFNPISDAFTYSELSNIPSDNATADIVYADATTAGKVLLANAAPGAIASSGATGSSTRVALQDHTHEGVHSIQIDGDPTQGKGDVVFKPGTGVTITWSGGKVQIDALGGVGYQETPGGVVNGVNNTFGPLFYTPSSADSVWVFVDGILRPNTEWSLVGLSIVFNAGAIPQLGQEVYVAYLYAGVPALPPVPTGTPIVEYVTVSAGQEAAKKIILSNTPASASLVMLDIIGGSAQEFNVDYTVVTNELRWNGYALDGLLLQNDRVRIFYFT
jgi:hypothetical protein